MSNIESKQVVTTGAYFSETERDRLNIANAWENYQLTRNPHYLADALLGIDFFGQPEAASEIARLIRDTTSKAIDKVSDDISDSIAARWAKRMQSNEGLRLVALNDLNDRLVEVGLYPIPSEQFKTIQRFRWAALILAGAIPPDSDEKAAAEAMRKRAKRRRPAKIIPRKANA